MIGEIEDTRQRHRLVSPREIVGTLEEPPRGPGESVP